MEDDKRLVLYRLQFAGDFLGQRVNLLAIVLGVLFILRSVFGVAFAECLGDIRRQNLSVLRVEPEMQIIFTVTMVMVMPTFRCFGGMIVPLVGIGGILLVIVSMVMTFGTMVVTFMAMVMRFERTTFTELQLGQSFRFTKSNNLCAIAKCIDGLVEEGFHRRPSPENHLGVLDCFGIGGFQAVDMFGTRTLNDQFRLAHPLHDCGNNGMERFDRDHDAVAFCRK